MFKTTPPALDSSAVISQAGWTPTPHPAAHCCMEVKLSLSLRVMVGIRLMWSSTQLPTQRPISERTAGSSAPESKRSFALSLQCIVHLVSRSWEGRDAVKDAINKNIGGEGGNNYRWTLVRVLLNRPSPETFPVPRSPVPEPEPEECGTDRCTGEPGPWSPRGGYSSRRCSWTCDPAGECGTKWTGLLLKTSKRTNHKGRIMRKHRPAFYGCSPSPGFGPFLPPRSACAPDALLPFFTLFLSKKGSNKRPRRIC